MGRSPRPGRRGRISLLFLLALTTLLGARPGPELHAQVGRDLSLAYEALGLEPLAEKVARGFQGRELRLRTSVSYAVPHGLVVVRTEGGGWEGGAWLWSGGLMLGDPQPPRRLGSCQGVDFSLAFTCRSHDAGEVDWDAVAALAFDTLEVLSLPSPQDMPTPSRGVVDGLFLGVEVAGDGVYRSLSWINHEVRAEPEARRALALHRLVTVLTARACSLELPPPWPARTARLLRDPPECSRGEGSPAGTGATPVAVEPAATRREPAPPGRPPLPG